MQKLLLTTLSLLLLFTPQVAGAYWQQRVNYTIDVKLIDEKARKFEGQQNLWYVNNSPDTLKEIYFHAYLNSMRKGSRMDKRRQQFGDYSLWSSKPDEWGELKIKSVKDHRDQLLLFDLDETIFKVWLPTALGPGESTQFLIEFDFILPTAPGGRFGYIEGQFKGGYWYPAVCVYDHKMGWVNNQFLGAGEAYHEFGQYNVSLTFPAHYLVGATGVLQNKEEVLSDSLLKKLDLKNFKDKPWNSPASVIIPRVEGQTKTWKFYAENVNDFAFIADPTFRIGRAEWDGIQVYTYVQEKHAAGWQEAAELGARGIQYFSEHFGRYAYPQMIIGDSYDGMEYPMLVMCGGRSPSYRLVIWHEIAHNWFMGAVGSNQVDRAFLDEGFTTFAEIACIEHYHGRQGNINFWDTWYKKNFYPLDEDRAARGYRPYLLWSKAGFALPMILSADAVPENMVYRVSSYYKTVAMLFSLQSVLGDSVFWRVLQTYYDLWKFKHPYEEDFRAVVEEVSRSKLGWFFDEWLYTTKQCDYAVKDVRGRWLQTDTGRVYRAQIKIARYEKMALPIDLRLKLKNKEQKDFLIPLDEYHKPTEAQVLPLWHQIRNNDNLYIATIDLPDQISQVEIDPSGRLPDINPLNNRKPLPKVDIQFDNLKVDYYPIDAYHLSWRPHLWFNSVDKLLLGWHSYGSYLGFDHQVKYEQLIASRTFKIWNAEIKYRTPISGFDRLTYLEASFFHREGRQRAAFGFFKESRKRWLFPPVVTHTLSILSENLFDSNYLSEPASWTVEPVNSLLYQFTHYSRYRPGSLKGRLLVEKSLSKPDFSRVAYELQTLWQLKAGGIFRIRLFVGFSDNDQVAQKLFRLNGAGSEEQLVAPILRSRGTVPNRWADRFRLVGGGDFRTVSKFTITARSVLSQNLELILPPIKLVGGLRRIPLIGNYLSLTRVYGFINGGIASNGASDRFYRYEGGVGFKFSHIWKNHKFQIDFPLLAGDAKGKISPLKWQWFVGWEVE